MRFTPIFLFAMLAMFFACEQTQTTSSEETTATAAPEEEMAMGAEEVTCGTAQTCPTIPSSISCTQSGNSYEMDNACADNYMCKYSNKLIDICNETKGNDDNKYLVKGFEVQFDELRQVYDSATAMGSQVKVFSMMGITDNDETDMIFVLEITNGSTTTQRSFDFTSPCPPACPKD